MNKSEFQDQMYDAIRYIDKVGMCDLCGRAKILEPIKLERSILKICDECKSWRKRIFKKRCNTLLDIV